MAGVALTTPLTVIRRDECLGQFPIKSAEVVNQGDLVGLDSNGSVVVASSAAAGVIHAIGFADFNDELGGATLHTGVAGLTVYASIYRVGKIGNLSSLTKGARVYLDAAPTGGADNYTQQQPRTAGDLIQPVGYAVSATEIEVRVSPSVMSYSADARAPYSRLQ